MRKYLKEILLIVLGGVLVFPVFIMTNYAMFQTSTPRFCASCHEIRPAYNEWQMSSHVNNARGVVADCMDCHLPPFRQTLNFYYKKVYHGSKDVVAHLVGGPYDRLENRIRAYEDIENGSCLECHGNLLNIPNRRGAMLAHKTVLYPRQGYEKKCTQCHDNLVHKPSPLYRYKT